MARVLGLISGTSCDAIDGAFLATDGRNIEAFGPARSIPWSEADRNLVRRAAKAMAAGFADAPAIARAGVAVTQAHIAFVRDFIAACPDWQPDLVGFHGQTIFHAPERQRSCQIGSPQALADAVGIPVVADFRQADIKAGGQGAPLAPLYHFARAQKSSLPAPLAVLNLGGVGNLTFIGESETQLLAFDTGPGMAPLDDWAARHWGGKLDQGGKKALKGRVRETLLARLLKDGFFTRPLPKSLDREAFALPALCARLPELAQLSPQDGAALLAAFTAHSVFAGLKFFPRPPQLLLVAGGGRHHAAVMAELARLCAFPVHHAEKAGWRGDALEAECFACLAARSRAGLPLTLPGTTGVARPLAGGVFYSPAASRQRGCQDSGEAV